MVTTNQSELSASVPPCQHCGAGRVFEVQLMPTLVAELKCAKQSNATHNVGSQNMEQSNVKKQFSQGNYESNVQTFENGGVEVRGEIADHVLQEEQRRTFMTAVNQMYDMTIEFGTVMVFTCSQSCWRDAENCGGAVYLDEFCLVEADPDEKLFQ